MNETPHTFRELVLCDLLRGQRLVRRINDEGGIDPQFRIATPEGDIAIAMTLSPNMQERAHQLNMLKLFMAYKTALGFIMTTELKEPDAITAVGVNRHETLAVVAEIPRAPLGFGAPQMCYASAIRHAMLSLRPRGALAIT